MADRTYNADSGATASNHNSADRFKGTPVSVIGEVDKTYEQQGFRRMPNDDDEDDIVPLESKGLLVGVPKSKQPRRFKYDNAPRDFAFALLYLLDLLAILLLFFLSISWLRDDDPQEKAALDSIRKDASFTPTAAKVVASIGVTCMVVGVLLASLWLHFIKQYASTLIKLTMWASVLWNVAGAGVMFYTQLWFAGVMFLLAAAASAFFYYSWRHRIPFATALLQTVASLLERFPGIVRVAYAALLAQFLWLMVWVFASAAALTLDTGHKNWLAVFLVFSFFWTSQVIKNVVHTTTAGTMATWYFLDNTTAMPLNPTRKAWYRSVTTSFGSICFGSLLIALVKTARSIVHQLRKRAEKHVALLRLLDMLMACLDDLVSYFNLYAFTQVAIYGKTYCQASRDTWELIKERGFKAIVNDNLVANVLWFGCLVGGVITACVSGIWAYTSRSMSADWPVAVSIGFFIGFVMMLTCMEVVESAVVSLFVCFAEAPDVLRTNNPDLYSHFESTYTEVFSSYV